MDQQFTIGQLVAFVAIILGIAIGVYLVIILYRLSQTIKRVNAILDTNRTNIDNTLNSVPSIAQNVNEITESIRNKTTLLDNLFASKEDNETDGSLGNLVELISSLTGILGLISQVKDFFFKKKRKFFR